MPPSSSADRGPSTASSFPLLSVVLLASTLPPSGRSAPCCSWRPPPAHFRTACNGRWSLWSATLCSLPCALSLPWHPRFFVRRLTWHAGFAGNGLVGYLLTTNITCFTHGTYKIDSKATNDAWQVRACVPSTRCTLSARCTLAGSPALAHTDVVAGQWRRRRQDVPILGSPPSPGQVMRRAHLRHAHGKDESGTPGRKRIFCTPSRYGIHERSLPAAHTLGWRGFKCLV